MSGFSRPFVLRMLSWAALAHAVLFLAFWLTNSLFYASTNDFLAGVLGARMDYIRIGLWVVTLLGLWSLARLLSSRLGWKHPLAQFTGGLYGFLAVIFLLLFYGSFAVLFHEDPVQLPRLIQLIGYFRLVLDTVLYLSLALLLRHWLFNRPEAQNRVTWLKPVRIVLILIACAWCLPLFFPPGSVYHGALPQKPRIIAHRGASMIAPENTLAAAERAADLRVYGLETDIHISRDGLPFLMHDDTLKRTTNVAQVFPGREKERAENFTLAEVRQLNAGQWFVEQDPFQAIARGKVSAQQRESYRSQSVPTLAEALGIVRQHGLIFIFDLKQPPVGQPYRSSFFDICLKQIQQTGIDGQVWFLVNRSELNLIKAAAPQMKPTYGLDYRNPLPAADLKDAGYQIVNSEYPLSVSWIRQYQSAGLWVNLYTVDEAWQFSRLWLMGVNSITSSNAQALVSLASPVMSMAYPAFVAVWMVVGLLGVLIVILHGRSHHPAAAPE